MIKAVKIFLTLVLISFVFNAVGFIFLFVGAKEKLKEETWKEISELKSSKRIEVLSISVADYEAGKLLQRINEREIRFQGKMYDVVKEERQDGKLIFSCIHDEKEDELNKEFSNEVRKNLDSKSATNPLTNLLQLIQYAETGKKVNVSSPEQKNSYSNFCVIQHSQIDLQVLTPPPKLIFA